MLVCAGALKRGDPTLAEDYIVLRAIRDMNLPKFIKADAELFRLLLGDLFPSLELPPFEDKENYVHRIGRCGRFGRKGLAISFVNPSEQTVMAQIAEHYKFVPKDMPQNVASIQVD